MTVPQNWLRVFMTNCMQHTKIPKIWRRAKIIAILKPGKNPDEAASYHPITLLLVGYKLLKRLIYNRLLPVVDPQLSCEQAGFRPRRSTVEQAVKLTEDINTAFETGKKCGAVLVDLSAAYNTVWHRGLTLKMLCLIRSKHMVRFVQELITNRSFKLHADKDMSKTYTIKNGVQGSILSPMLFNIYTSDIPHTASTQYIYADDIALMESRLNYADIQQTLTNDLICLDLYLQQWCLQLNVNKTVSSCFHLANHQMEVRCREKITLTTANPKYLGVTLDRSLTYSKHLSQLSKKANARCNLLQ